MFFTVAITSLVSGFLLLSLMESDDISDNMVNIAENPTKTRISIVGDLVTSIGIVFLGLLLYNTLKGQNQAIALAAFGLYIIEAVVLAVSRIGIFALLNVSQEFVEAGAPDASYLLTLGRLTSESAQFGYDMHLLFFAVGAFLFYYLFYKSRAIPIVFSLWGMIAVSLAFIGILFILFDYEVGIFVLLPNMFFELTIGIWLMIKGIEPVETEAVTD